MILPGLQARLVIDDAAPLNRVMLMHPRRIVEFELPDGRVVAQVEPYEEWARRCAMLVLTGDKRAR